MGSGASASLKDHYAAIQATPTEDLQRNMLSLPKESHEWLVKAVTEAENARLRKELDACREQLSSLCDRVAEQDDILQKPRIQELLAEVRDAKKLVAENPNAFWKVPMYLRADKEVVLVAVEKNCWNLQYASKELCADKEVVLAAVKQGAEAIQFASEGLRKDPMFVLEVVALNSFASVALSSASEELRADRIFVLEAVTVNGLALGYASKELRTDREIVLAAVKQDGRAIEFAAKELRADKEVVVAAAKNDGRSIQFASKNLRADKEVVLAAAKEDGGAIEFASKELRADKEVVLEAVKQDHEAWEIASEELQADRNFLLEAMALNGLVLKYAPEELRDNKAVVIEAARQDASALRYASDQWKQHEDCLKAAGLWHEPTAKTRTEGVIFSVKFSFAEEASDLTTRIMQALDKHPFMGEFKTYNPNLISKKSCDEKFTRITWACRGTDASCTLKNTRDDAGKPTKNSCWRLSFRWHQEECKSTNGFMIQIEELLAADLEKNLRGLNFRIPDLKGYSGLGAGQKVESVMAELVNLKVFRVQLLDWDPNTLRTCLEKEFYTSVADKVANAVCRWYAAGAMDTELEIIRSWP